MSMRLTRCEIAVIGISMVCYAALVVYVQAAGYNVVNSDCLRYNHWSYAWLDFSQRCSSQLPLFPITLWAFRGLTFGLLPDGVVMQAVALLFGVGGLVYVHKILSDYLPAARNSGFFLFALFPLVGLWFAVDPRADTLAILCLTGAMYYSLKGNWRLFALCLAAGLVTHKAIWPFLALLSVDAVWRKKCPLFWPLAAGVPLLIYWCWGLYHGQSALWFFQENVAVEFASKSSLPIMDGMLGTLLHAKSAAKLLKALLIVAIFAVTVGLLVWNIRRLRQPDAMFNIALLLPVFLLAVLLNQHEVFSTVRFGRVIAIPVAAFLVVNERLRKFLERPACFYAAVVVCVLTNVAFSYYATKWTSAM